MISKFVLASMLTLTASMKDLPSADNPLPTPQRRAQAVDHLQGILDRAMEEADDDYDDPREFWERIESASKPSRSAKRAPTKWIIRFEGEKTGYLVPIATCKKLGLRPGQSVSLKTARLIIISLGAKYPPGALERLEELEKLK